MITKEDRRRYKLHHRLRKQEGKIKTADRTVFVNCNETEETLPKEAKELRDKFGYSIQKEIE